MYAKSAATILAAYEAIEAIPDDSQSWPAAIRQRQRLAANLAAHADAVKLYKILATLRRDAPIEEEPPELEWLGVPRSQFHDLCGRLGFRELLQRPKRWRDDFR